MSHTQPDSGPPVPPVPLQGAPGEPLLTVGTITTLATAALACLVAFRLPVDNNQQAQLLGLIAVLAPLIVAGVGRLRTWSPASVRKIALAERAKRQR